MWFYMSATTNQANTKEKFYIVAASLTADQLRPKIAFRSSSTLHHGGAFADVTKSLMSGKTWHGFLSISLGFHSRARPTGYTIVFGHVSHAKPCMSPAASKVQNLSQPNQTTANYVVLGWLPINARKASATEAPKSRSNTAPSGIVKNDSAHLGTDIYTAEAIPEVHSACFQLCELRLAAGCNL